MAKRGQGVTLVEWNINQHSMQHMKAVQPDETLVSVAGFACQAGRIILPFFRGVFSHRLKEDSSPVTEADLASHTYLVQALGKLSPRRSVISEESAHTEPIAKNAVEDYWLVDPLDGTKEFMKGKSEFTVNIALMAGRRPVLGVVHAPALGVTYLAQVGQGAWRQRGLDPAVPIHTRPADLAHLTIVASKDHSGPRVKGMLQKLPAPAVRSIGSSLKFCLVAEGGADLYFRDLPTMEWDTAAAQCVVETAGGQVLDLNGEPLVYGKPDLRNPGFVVVGDTRFNWSAVPSSSVDKYSFRSFFAEIYREAESPTQHPH